MTDRSPIILWLRRDFRLADHPALNAACASGRPVIPVFICDPLVETLGAAPKWRLELAVEHFAEKLAGQGSRLVLRRGDALSALRALLAETGAGAVYWSRLYDPESVARDTEVKTALKAEGIEARSFGGHLMFEPWQVETKTGGYYKVYSPFWRAVQPRDIEVPLPAPGAIPAPDSWPVSDTLSEWQLGAAMRRGAAIVRPFVQLGETAAQERLGRFVTDAVRQYSDQRDFVAVNGTSCLSENLSLGEISPHQCWHAAEQAVQDGAKGAETFRKQLVWREFAYHLMHHTPRLLTGNWRQEWDGFAWQEETPDAWIRARTGIEIVDAGLREMFVTGRMHNRVRMIVASYLTKHMLTHWRIGLRWFEDCLIDWDPACNALGWQWVAGSGPDAAPYFRVFNPVTQAEKFDPDCRYRDRWLAEGRTRPHADAMAYFEAVPRRWGLSPNDLYPAPVVDLAEGRQRALAVYEGRRF